MRDIWLLKLDTSSHAFARTLASMRAQVPDLQTWLALDGSGCYSFTWAHDSPAFDVTETPCTWQRLRCVQELPGASAGHAFWNHYIVETDVLAESEDDLNAWYAQEHLPGLASVPGTVRAARYIDDGGKPRYYACYDLTHADVLGSPAWLEVRETPWSARVRPAFRNTRRTMFQRTMSTPR